MTRHKIIIEGPVSINYLWGRYIIEFDELSQISIESKCVNEEVDKVKRKILEGRRREKNRKLLEHIED